jgi:excisionase family DNA binding protein
MSKVISMEGVRSGTAHLKRARELGKSRGARSPRPVPVGEIISSGGNVFTVQELSQLVRLAPITIRRAIRSGALRAANGGGKSGYRITRGDIETWWRSRGGGDLFEVADATAPEYSDQKASRLAALDHIGTYNTRAGLPPLSDDAVADAYCEREDAQR